VYPHITYLEAIVVGLIQGVTELFPISSLGHNVLIPALVGGKWAQDLSVSAPESPYLAFIVGMHVATALAMITYYWRDWLLIIKGFFGSVAHVILPAPGTRRWATQTVEQKLAWMIILATIPVGIAGLALEHDFRVYFSKPVPTALFLALNGVILLYGERVRRRRVSLQEQQMAEDRRIIEGRQMAAAGGPAAGSPAAGSPAAGNPAAGGPPGEPAHAAGRRELKQHEADLGVLSNRRLVRLGWRNAFGLGASQILALLPGISRDGMVMVSGMVRGLTMQDAARFSFLLSAPVIFAAGVLKIPDLTGPLGNGVRGQVLVGSIMSGVGAYLALRFFVRYISDPKRTLTPFAVYCLVFGLGSAIYLGIR
jgi:undecaprenyl-diphosphatase